MALGRNERLLIVPPPVPFSSQQSKDLAVTLVKAALDLAGVSRYVFVSESWALHTKPGEAIDRDALEREGLSKGLSTHPDRKEMTFAVKQHWNALCCRGEAPCTSSSP